MITTSTVQQKSSKNPAVPARTDAKHRQSLRPVAQPGWSDPEQAVGALNYNHGIREEVKCMAKSTRNSGKAWSSSDKQQLAKLAKGNTPTRVIGIKLGRSEDAVSSQASKQHVSLKPTNQSPYGSKGKK
ncbi:MAG: hypothetical protein ABR575_11690 [Actinomycetota bacterium]